MANSDYFTAAEITDDVIAKHVTADDNEYLLLADKEIEDLGEQLGERDPDSFETPLHFKLKEYGLTWIGMRVARDKMGVNNADVGQLDKYLAKFDMYSKELKKLRPQISREMFVGEVNEIRDRASVGTIFHG